ncbi:MAG: peptide deformylase [Oscillospiraceae bacterium]|jgi:peptide deformylase|nr:peptide deformylase [Oscillospiraceae bacterium]MBQ4241026.1 peptide deformylase [Oscillospiraceae bacterium]MBQ5412069.1 peptide deformylase [Oscillospiraceae bacterium]
MALRNIVKIGDPLLRKKSRPVTDFNERITTLIDDMKETLVDANGLGLAAPQVGVLRRVVIVVNNDGEYLELVNPEITARSQETVGAYEGCLSVPDERGYLERPRKVIVKAQDRTGKSFTISLEEMAARAACHEIDHLDGTLFVDLTKELYTEEELDRMLSEQDGENED